MGCIPPKDASVVLGPERIANASVKLAIWAVCSRISERKRATVLSYSRPLRPRYTAATHSAAIASAAAHQGIQPARRSSDPTEARIRRRSWDEGPAGGPRAPINRKVLKKPFPPAKQPPPPRLGGG